MPVMVEAFNQQARMSSQPQPTASLPGYTLLIITQLAGAAQQWHCTGASRRHVCSSTTVSRCVVNSLLRKHCGHAACHSCFLQVITQDRTGHREPVRGALYNRTFGVVVSVDEGGTVCVWNLQVG